MTVLIHMITQVKCTVQENSFLWKEYGHFQHLYKWSIIFNFFHSFSFNNSSRTWATRASKAITATNILSQFQNKLLLKLRNKEVVLAGDGRHDSMGHSDKYGTYSIFCCTIGLIIHIVLVQVCHFIHSVCHWHNLRNQSFVSLQGVGLQNSLKFFTCTKC